MMDFFALYLHMALSGTVALFLLLLVRRLLKRVPKRLTCFLWMIVMFRLLCPYTIEGPVPKFWVNETVIEENGKSTDNHLTQQPVEEGFPNREMEERQNNMAEKETMSPVDKEIQQDDFKQPNISHQQNGGNDLLSADKEASCLGQNDTSIEFPGKEAPGDELLVPGRRNIWKLFFTVASYVWLIGMIAMATGLLLKYVRISKGLSEATPLTRWKGIMVKQSNFPGVPMVFGLWKPCIFVPYGFDSEKERMILIHEAVHIRHKDTLRKVIAYAALTIHWWNPLVWLGVALFQKDMEMSCDEAALEQMTGDCRAEYSRMLLQYAMKRSGLILPMGFGESNTEERVRNVLDKKRLPVWGTGLVLVMVVVFGICIATKPHEQKTKESDNPIEAEVLQSENIVYQEGEKIVCSSVDDFENVFLERWKTKLLDKGLAKEASAIFRWLYKREPIEASEVLNYYFCTITDQGDLKVYCTKAQLSQNETEFIADNISEEILYDRTTQEGMKNFLELGVPYNFFVSKEQNGTSYVLWRRLVDVIADCYRNTNEGRYEALKEPLSAIRELYGFTGEGEFVASGLNSGSVYWKEKIEGETVGISILMDCKEGIWFPWDVDFATDEREAAFRRQVEYIKGLEALDSKTLERESIPVGQVSYGAFYKAEKEYILLEQVGDVSFYCTRDEENMIVRNPNGLYVIPGFHDFGKGWSFTIGDFDRDGSEEYAIETANKWGTECFGTELLVVKPQSGKEKEAWKERAIFYKCTDENWLRELSNRVTYNVSVMENRISIYADGEYQCAIDFREKMNEWEKEGQKVSIDSVFFGDLNAFKCADGQWFLTIRGGICGEESRPLYEYGVRGECPVYFGVDGTVSFGEFRFETETELQEWIAFS